MTEHRQPTPEKRKRFLFSSVFFLISGALLSQPFHFVDGKSTIRFHIRNFGVTVTGTVKGLTGQVVLATNPGDNYFVASIRSATVDTGISLRDRHLRAEDYFNAIAFPEITIRSKAVTMNDKSRLAVADVTMKGVTREVSFPFEATERSGAVIFTGMFRLNRRDFNVGGRSISLSDDVQIEFRVTGER